MVLKTTGSYDATSKDLARSAGQPDALTQQLLDAIKTPAKAARK